MRARSVSASALVGCAAAACLEAPPARIADVADADPGAVADGSDASPRDEFLVARYPFDDSAVDVAGTNDATCSACPAPDPDGRIGGAYEFTGGQHLSIPMSDELRVIEGTATVWIKNRTVFESTEAMVGVTLGDATAQSWELFLGSAENVRFASDDGPTISTVAAVPRDEWTHLAATWDAGRRSLYVDGAVAASASAIRAPAYDGQPIVVGIAVDHGLDVNPFSGSLDDLRIYRRALSADEIMTIVAEAPAR